MTEMQAQKLVAVLVASYPGKFTDDSIALFRRMVLDLDYELANAAIDRHVSTSKWPPTPAEIREAALSLTVGEIRPGGATWGDVVKAIRKYGYMRSPGTDFNFDDPLVAQVVSAMDWVELCSSENQVADRARFIETYDHLAATNRRSTLSEGLPVIRQLRAKQELQRLEGQPKTLGQLIGEISKVPGR